MKNYAIGLLLLLSASCAARSVARGTHSAKPAQPQRSHPDQRFRQADVDNIQLGMGEPAIRKMFGHPDNVEIATCRPEGEDAWDCKILWYYNGIESNAFCFQSTGNDEWVLNSYDIRWQD